LVIQAPPETASTLGALFSGIAALLQAADAPGEEIPAGVVHKVPADLRKTPTSDPKAQPHGRILRRSRAMSGQDELRRRRSG
jgi:hypothetical protein